MSLNWYKIVTVLQCILKFPVLKLQADIQADRQNHFRNLYWVI